MKKTTNTPPMFLGFYLPLRGRKPRSDQQVFADKIAVLKGVVEQIIVFGIGPRVGSSAYDSMRERYGNILIGVDQQKHKVSQHLNAGRNVLQGDATDIDFWARVNMTQQENNPIKLVMLAMPDHNANMEAIAELGKNNFLGMIVATAQFDDEVEELKKAGATAFNFCAEAGYGFANYTSKAFVEDSLGLTENNQG